MTKPFSWKIDITLMEVNYNVENSKEPNIRESYRYELKSMRSGKSNRYVYAADVNRNNDDKIQYKISLSFLVIASCSRSGNDKEKAEMETQIKYMVGFRAAHIIYNLTDETLSVPDIFPPYFEDEGVDEEEVDEEVDEKVDKEVDEEVDEEK